MHKVDLAQWKDRLIQGDKLALAKVITLIESQKAEDKATSHELFSQLTPKDSKKISYRIGFTGTPGVGKSSLIEELGKLLINQRFRIAVLTVDPTSSISHGSILGDKSRMPVLSNSDHAYVRSSPASDSLGGIGSATYTTIQLLEVIGYDYIIIESVGIGQSETDIVNLCDLTICLIQPGSGDELQAIKRGIMEWADLFVIHKADGELKNQAKIALSHLKDVQGLRIGDDRVLPVEWLSTSIYEPSSIENLLNYINKFFNTLNLDNKLLTIRREKELRHFDRIWLHRLGKYIQEDHILSEKIKWLKGELQNGSIHLEDALDKLIKVIFVAR